MLRVVAGCFITKCSEELLHLDEKTSNWPTASQTRILVGEERMITCFNGRIGRHNTKRQHAMHVSMA